ncbi:MAG TPA: hypothetical protein VGJ30_00900 [Candidatus Angelobacter sp.]|jgi:hypothetical protein
MNFDLKIGDGDVISLKAEHRALLEAMFETLSNILALPDPRTQGFALHGLGHLHHPGVRDLVQHFLDGHREDFTPERDTVDRAMQGRDGNVRE